MVRVLIHRRSFANWNDYRRGRAEETDFRNRGVKLNRGVGVETASPSSRLDKGEMAQNSSGSDQLQQNFEEMEQRAATAMPATGQCSFMRSCS